MQFLISFFQDRFAAVRDEEDAAVGFEYLLVVGGVSVAIVIAMAAAPGAVAAVTTGMCAAIATIPGFGGVAC